MSTYTSIRGAGVSDVECIALIHTTVWREVYSFMPEEVHLARNLKHRRKQWLEWLERAPSDEVLLVLEKANQVVGFAVAKPNTDTDIHAAGEFHACYILPEFRGGDTGPVAMLALAEFLKFQGLWPACIWAFKHNPYRRIYPALGCRPVVFRNRVIAGYSLPEIGYAVTDFGELTSRLNRMRASAAQR